MNEKKTYAVPALAKQIELAWADELASHYGRARDEVQEKIRPWFSFPPGTLRIELMDQSCVEFRHAIHIVSESKYTIAVFTEHCGHHLYPNHDARVFRDGELVYEQISAWRA
jgi:hypothetical protein